MSDEGEAAVGAANVVRLPAGERKGISEPENEMGEKDQLTV